MFRRVVEKEKSERGACEMLFFLENFVATRHRASKSSSIKHFCIPLFHSRLSNRTVQLISSRRVGFFTISFAFSMSVTCTRREMWGNWKNACWTRRQNKSRQLMRNCNAWELRWARYVSVSAKKPERKRTSCNLKLHLAFIEKPNNTTLCCTAR